MVIAEVQDLVKKYPSFELKNVSFGLESGRITGFIGRNGAGKTTTIKAMLNMFPGENKTVVYFEDTKIRRGTRCKPDERLITELINVLGLENVVLK